MAAVYSAKDAVISELRRAAEAAIRGAYCQGWRDYQHGRSLSKEDEDAAWERAKDAWPVLSVMRTESALSACACRNADRNTVGEADITNAMIEAAQKADDSWKRTGYGYEYWEHVLAAAVNAR